MEPKQSIKQAAFLAAFPIAGRVKQAAQKRQGSIGARITTG